MTRKLTIPLLALLALASPLLAQQQLIDRPDYVLPIGPQTATGRSTVVDNRGLGITTWHFVYACSSCATVSAEIDYANDSAGTPGSWTIWPAGDLASGTTLPLTDTSAGQATAFKFKPYVSVNVSTLTGAGARVLGTLYGYRAKAGQDSAGTSSVTTTTSTVDPTTVRLVYTSAQTNGVLVAAPSAGNRLVIVGVFYKSSVTANFSVLIGLHATVTPTGLQAIVSDPACGTRDGIWMQLGGSAIGVGADGEALLITTGTIADGALHVIVKYIVEAIP